MSEERNRGGVRNWQVACALGVMGLMLVLARAHNLHEPLEADIVTYAAIGHEMASGKRLYTDVWDVKPPGLYVTYELGELVAGYGDNEVYFLGLGCALCTLLAVYAAGAALGRPAGLVAAAFWTALSGMLVIQANQPNSEVFINATYVAAFALLVRHPPAKMGWARSLLIGVLFALGSTYKPVVAFLAVMVAAAHIWEPPPGLSRATALAEVALMGVGGGVVWGLIFGYAAMTGQMAIYWTTNVVANRHRSAGILFNLYRYLREGKIFPHSLWFLLPLVLLLIFAAVRGLRQGARREWLLFVALTLGVHLMIFSQGGAFHPHSYQMWLPTLAIGAGWAITAFADDPRLAGGGFLKRHLGEVAAAVAFAVVLVHEVPNYFQPAAEWARRKYNETVVQDPPFARAVAALLQPSETLFEYGDGAIFYYYGRLRPITPTLWSVHLLSLTPLGRQLTETTLSRLQDQPPDLFVVDRAFMSPPPRPTTNRGLALRLLASGADVDHQVAWNENAVYTWALANYRPWTPDQRLAVRSSHYDLLVRRGSALERRLTGE